MRQRESERELANEKRASRREKRRARGSNGERENEKARFD